MALAAGARSGQAWWGLAMELIAPAHQTASQAAQRKIAEVTAASRRHLEQAVTALGPPSREQYQQPGSRAGQRTWARWMCRAAAGQLSKLSLTSAERVRAKVKLKCSTSPQPLANALRTSPLELWTCSAAKSPSARVSLTQP